MNATVCDQLDDYLSDAMSQQQRGVFEQHLQTCGQCQHECRQQAKLDELLSQAAAYLPAMPQGLLDQTEAHIRLATRRRAFWASGVTAAAACLAGLLVAGVWFSQPPPPQPRIVQSAERPVVKVEAASPDDVLVMPIETDVPNVSFFWVYPTLKWANKDEEPGALQEPVFDGRIERNQLAERNDL